MTNRIANWIDLSVEIVNGMPHYPGDPDVSIEKIMSFEKGDESNLTKLSLCAHTGTHIDAPLHFIKDGTDIADIRIDLLIGKTKVVEIKNKSVVEISDIENKLDGCQRIILKTKNSDTEWWKKEFSFEYCYLSTEAAEFLRIKNIMAVGIDYHSIGGKDNEKEVHKILLGAGIIIIEGLNLSQVNEGKYEMFCLPIKVKNADGAPARVLLRNI